MIFLTSVINITFDSRSGGALTAILAYGGVPDAALYGQGSCPAAGGLPCPLNRIALPPAPCARGQTPSAALQSGHRSTRPRSHHPQSLLQGRPPLAHSSAHRIRHSRLPLDSPSTNAANRPPQAPLPRNKDMTRQPLSRVEPFYRAFKKKRKAKRESIPSLGVGLASHIGHSTARLGSRWSRSASSARRRMPSAALAPYSPAYSDSLRVGNRPRSVGRTGGLPTEKGENSPFTPF